MYVQSLEYHSTLRSRRSWGDWDLLRILMFLTMLTFFAVLLSFFIQPWHLTVSLMPVFFLFVILTDLQTSSSSHFPSLATILFFFFLQTWNPPIFTCPLSPSQCLGPLSAPDPEDPVPASPPPPADSLPLVSRSRFSRSYRSLSCDETKNVKNSC